MSRLYGAGGVVTRSGIVCLFAYLFLTQCSLAESIREDNQIWLDGQYTFPLWQNLELTPAGTFRFGRDVGDLVYERAGISLAYRPPELALDFSLLQLHTKPALRGYRQT
jgi:hypothetical protein